MLPELLRFSSAHHLLDYIPDEIQNVHRASAEPTPAPPTPAPPAPPAPSKPIAFADNEIDDDVLGALGL
tara:strand:- start:4518 stop:4724 length:207 start_codon:yes stop_codon:yes gene_type:complete